MKLLYDSLLGIGAIREDRKGLATHHHLKINIF